MMIIPLRSRKDTKSSAAFAFPALTPVAVAALATAVEALKRRREQSRRRPRGQLIALRPDGRRLHVIYDTNADINTNSLPPSPFPQSPDASSRHASTTAAASGRAPCIVMEAGSNSWSTIWDEVAGRVGRFTRVFRYDRFGYNFSDPFHHHHHYHRHRPLQNWSSPPPSSGSRGKGKVGRSPTSIANDLCAALASVGAAPPYIFVAHSLGALYVNAAVRALKPADVCGVVYVDAASTRTISLLRGTVPTSPAPVWLAHLLASTGVLRYLAPLALLPYWRAFPPFLREEARTVWARAKWLLAYTSEWAGAIAYSENIHRNVQAYQSTNDSDTVYHGSGELEGDEDVELGANTKAVGDPGWLGDTPIAVLVPDVYSRTKGKTFVAPLQEKVAQYSSDATLFHVENSGHFIQLDRPDAVVDAIRHVIKRAHEVGKISYPLLDTIKEDTISNHCNDAVCPVDSQHHIADSLPPS